MKAILGAAVVAGLLSGCATQYGSSGITGGHFETGLPGPLVKVSFAGNGYTHASSAQSYAMYRCAEVAKSRGSAHFVIYESLRHAALDVPSRLPLVGSMGNKPLASAFLRPLDAPTPGSFRTEDVLVAHAPTPKDKPADSASR